MTFAAIYSVGMLWGAAYTMHLIREGRSILSTPDLAHLDDAQVKAAAATMVLGSALLWPVFMVAAAYDLLRR